MYASVPAQQRTAPGAQPPALPNSGPAPAAASAPQSLASAAATNTPGAGPSASPALPWAYKPHQPSAQAGGGEAHAHAITCPRIQCAFGR